MIDFLSISLKTKTHLRIENLARYITAELGSALREHCQVAEVRIKIAEFLKPTHSYTLFQCCQWWQILFDLVI